MTMTKNDAGLPTVSHWNNYWSLDGTKKFHRVSWSKQRIMQILSSYIREGGWALDAGCGSGFFSKYFCDSKMNTVSLDYSEEALEISRRMTEGRSRALKADLLSENLAEKLKERFDIIFTDGLLEHFTEDQQNLIMKNLGSVLSSTGVLVTFVPNRWSPWELIRPLYMPGIEEKPFVLTQLTRLNQRNGFVVTKSGGINTIPFGFSPDKIFGSCFGMLLYTIARKN